MIYTFPSAGESLRQGDIFVGLPRIEISLNSIVLLNEGELTPEATTWKEILESGKTEATAVLGIKSVSAIVMTQDCDAQRSPDITLCEIRSISTINRELSDTTRADKFVKLLCKQARESLKWFYLPPDNGVGFTGRMAADFLTTIRVPREDLENLRQLRKGRLNDEADEHFRERMSDFFRRYPYDEWYPLSKAEFSEYEKIHPGTSPRPYQASSTTM